MNGTMQAVHMLSTDLYLPGIPSVGRFSSINHVADRSIRPLYMLELSFWAAFRRTHRLYSDFINRELQEKERKA